MKSLEEFLEHLANLNVKLWLEDGRLRCRIQKDQLSPELRAELAERKEEILKFLQRNQLNSSSHYQPIQPIDRSQDLPLSFPQQRLWFLDQLDHNSSYNEGGAICLEGILDVEILHKALQEIVRRHEILRTNFQIKNNNPVQIIHENTFLPLHQFNLEGLGDDEQEKEINKIAIQHLQELFDLVTDKLLKVVIIKLSDNKHILIVILHHIICDAWTFGILIRELSILYQAFISGQSSPLTPLVVQYADYAAWQRERLQGQELDRQLEYWKKQLANLPPLLELPIDHPRPSIQTINGKRQNFTLSPELSQKLKQLSQQSGVTLFMILLSAFSILLSRYSRQEDIAIGSPIANRNRQEIEPLIGFFVNTLVMRVNLENNPTVEEVLKQVKKTCLEAYSHQDVPFEKLVEELKPERNMSHRPLFQVMFVLQNTPNEKLSLPGLTLSPVEIEYNIAKFDLALSMSETEKRLEASWSYNTDLFARETIERMIGHFQVLLEGIVANPQEKIGKLPILTEPEKQQIIVEWNDTKADYPKDKCIHQLFEEQVEKTPDTVAVVYEKEELTYRELNQKANQLAHYLQRLGVKPDTLVGICVERSLEMVIGLLGILKAGGAYLPIDPNYPAERINYMLNDAAVSILLTQEKLIDQLPETKDKMICLDRNWSKIKQESEVNPTNFVTSDNLSYVIYTSGSTGKSKGVTVEHKSLVNVLFYRTTKLLKPEDLGMTPCNLSIAFDGSISLIFSPLIIGGTVIIIKDFIALQSELHQRQMTCLNLTPSAMNTLLEAVNLPSSIRLVGVGAESVGIQLIERLKEYPHIQTIINVYGPTEATIICSAAVLFERDQDFKQPISETVISIGKPIQNVQLYILDKNLQPLPIGVAGELHIGGDGLARGYLNRPELTAEKFISNPFDSTGQSKLYKTGDLCRYLSDGNIEYIGRIDHQVKIRGFRIELGEIESLLSTHPEIRESVVIAREDQPGNKRLVAYLVSNLIPDRLHYVKPCQLEINGRIYPVQSQDFSLGGLGLSQIPLELSVNEHDTVRLQMQLPGEETPTWLLGKVTWYHDKHAAIEWSLTAQEKEKIKQSYEWLKQELGIIDSLQRSLSQGLREYLKEKLPDYMIPSAFVLLEKLPLTTNGKIDRKVLPAPDWSQRTAADDFVAPESETEITLARIWQEVLRIEKVGITENFFELGGHSLLATQVISRIREGFSLEIPLRLLFECSTIAQLAESIERSRLTTEIQNSKNSSFDESDREEVEI